MAELLYGNFRQIESCRWFWSRSTGGLFYKNLENGRLECVCTAYQINGYIDGVCLFDFILVSGSKLFLIPRYADKILIWDTEQQRSTLVPLPEKPYSQGEYFLEALETDDEVVLIPQTYHGFVHINKNSLEAVIHKEGCEKKKDTCLFRALHTAADHVVYLAFYEKPQVLKYNIVSREVSVLETVHYDNGMAAFAENKRKFIVFNRQDCVQAKNDELIAFLAENQFLKEHHLIYAVDYHDTIYFFTQEGIFMTENCEKNIKPADWYDEIKEYYLNRIYVPDGDRLEDTLCIFRDGGALYVTFEGKECKYIITLDGGIFDMEIEKKTDYEEIPFILTAIRENDGRMGSIPAETGIPYETPDGGAGCPVAMGKRIYEATK